MKLIFLVGLVVSFDFCLCKPLTDSNTDHSGNNESSQSSTKAPGGSPGSNAVLVSTVGQRAVMVTTVTPLTSTTPRQNLTMENISFIMYAGKIIQALHTDDGFNNLKKMLGRFKREGKTVQDVMELLSEKTRKTLDDIKIEEVERIDQLKAKGTKAKPNYIDYIHVNKFSGLDLHLVLTKVNTMRSLLEGLTKKMPGL